MYTVTAVLYTVVCIPHNYSKLVLQKSKSHLVVYMYLTIILYFHTSCVVQASLQSLPELRYHEIPVVAAVFRFPVMNAVMMEMQTTPTKL